MARTEGVVLSCERDTQDEELALLTGKIRTVYRVKASYMAYGMECCMSFLSTDRYKTGSKITVRYNDFHPEKASVIRMRHPKILAAVIGSFFLLASGAMICLGVLPQYHI